jgi:dienelactone hydrolase
MKYYVTDQFAPRGYTGLILSENMVESHRGMCHNIVQKVGCQGRLRTDKRSCMLSKSRCGRLCLWELFCSAVIRMKSFALFSFLSILLSSEAILCGQCSGNGNSDSTDVPKEIAPFFKPHLQFVDDFGDYRSPLKFYDGTAVKTPADWARRRQEILKTWHAIMGSWPPLIEKPRIEYLAKEHRETFTQHTVRIEVAPQQQMVDGHLLVPDGMGPFAAVLIVYYDAETGIGLGKERRDFGYQLAKRGFVALSIGTPDFCSLAPPYKPRYEIAESQRQLQPLSALAYVGASCHSALASVPDVDAARIGIIGHSYGGKWAMFASCLYEKFACAVWSDPGIVFDESRANVNYWEPWYLGYESDGQRERGIPSKTNPRTGAYKELFENGHDLHELHALMAPRPFMISGGSEDQPERWKALNHTAAVNRLLGYSDRVAMTNRKGHTPTDESNEQIYLFFEHFLRLR